MADAFVGIINALIVLRRRDTRCAQRQRRARRVPRESGCRTHRIAAPDSSAARRSARARSRLMAPRSNRTAAHRNFAVDRPAERLPRDTAGSRSVPVTLLRVVLLRIILLRIGIDRPARLAGTLAGSRRAAAAHRQSRTLDVSASAATFNGNSAPQAPGPAIGEIRTTFALSLTSPDFMHAASASARQGSRSAVLKKPRPQPAIETRTSEPTRYKATLRVIRAQNAELP